MLLDRDDLGALGLRLAGSASGSRVNGPGSRFVVWVQGCTLGCKACFNPQTHAPNADVTPTDELARRVLAHRAESSSGLTLSGGEPFEQAVALERLGADLRRDWPTLNVLVFSGYTLEELRGPRAPRGATELLAVIDLLVDGRYVAADASARPLRASRNQRLWVLGRPAHEPLPAPLEVEVQIGPSGAILVSGFPDARLRRALGELAR